MRLNLEGVIGKPRCQPKEKNGDARSKPLAKRLSIITCLFVIACVQFPSVAEGKDTPEDAETGYEVKNAPLTGWAAEFEIFLKSSVSKEARHSDGWIGATSELDRRAKWVNEIISDTLFTIDDNRDDIARHWEINATEFSNAQSANDFHYFYSKKYIIYKNDRTFNFIRRGRFIVIMSAFYTELPPSDVTAIKRHVETYINADNAHKPL